MSSRHTSDVARGSHAGSAAIEPNDLTAANTAANTAAVAGLPDAATLARLAGEFFGVLGRHGGDPIAAAAPSPIPSGTAAPGVAPEAAIAQESRSRAGQIAPSVTAVSPEVAFPQGPGAPQPWSTHQPGVPADAQGLLGLPSLGFLADLRSLEAAVPAVTRQAPAPPVGVAVPTQPFGLSRDDIGAPQLPGVPLHATSWPATPAAGFLESARPLGVPGAAGGVAPTLAPVDSRALSGGGIPLANTSSSVFDEQAVRRDFPILQEQVNGRPLVWLDNAATTQKPQAVIDRLLYFYRHENSNVHRGAHTLAARATDAYEAARETVRAFLNASSTREIIFVRGTTEGINLIAQSWGAQHIHAGDEIVLTHLEHHANIVPWQMLCAETGATLRIAPVDDTGQIILSAYERLFTPRTRLAAFTHVSNALGTVAPVHEMTAIAHRHGAAVVVDGAQSVSHMPVDVQAIDCDFFVFSGHKIFGPTGIGVVYGKTAVLEQSPPYQGGGNMIADVTFERTLYHPPPLRFEAGTGNIADAVGLGAALDYVTRLGMENIARREHELLAYGTEVLSRIPGLTLVGTAREKASVLSFVLDGHRTEDVGAALAQQGIAVRAGHHCAQPILRRFGHESTVRPSLAFYNTCGEIDMLAAAIDGIRRGRVPSVA